MTDMFCFQCEQTAKGTGCTVSGVCGKKPEVARKHDELVCALIGLARAAEGKTPGKEADFPEHERNDRYLLQFQSRVWVMRPESLGRLSLRWRR